MLFSSQRSVSVLGLSALHGQCGTKQSMNDEKGKKGRGEVAGEGKHCCGSQEEVNIASGCLGS